MGSEDEGALKAEAAASTVDNVAAPSPAFLSLRQALEDARDKLLDRSLRNKLINTGLTSERAKQIRVFGASSDVIFQRLRGGRVAAFAARGDGEPNPSEPADAVDEDAGRPETDPRRRETKLQTRLTADGLKKRLTELFYESQTIEEEQGVSVLFLALGFLEWREAKASDVARYAPLILLPVDLTREAGRDRFKLKLRPDDMFANVSLQAWLKAQFGIALPDLPEGEDWLAAPYFDQIARAIGPSRGWRVHPDEMVLGFFSFSKFLMWRDLDPANWPDPTLLSENALLKIILLRGDGDDQPDSPLVGEDERIDEVFKPADLVHVTDADSSQALAIQEAMAGKNLVIQGPPGTGKSQTITNIIAGAVKRGKRVLFIAEKMAALDVVHQRLVDRKLGAICLELHSRKASKAQVIEQIKQARAAPAPPAWPIGVLSELEDLQHQLRAHSDGMHAVGPDGLSAFDLLGRMSLVKSRGAPAPDLFLAGRRRLDRRPSGNRPSPRRLSRRRYRRSRTAPRTSLARRGHPVARPPRAGTPSPAYRRAGDRGRGACGGRERRRVGPVGDVASKPGDADPLGRRSCPPRRAPGVGRRAPRIGSAAAAARASAGDSG